MSVVVTDMIVGLRPRRGVPSGLIPFRSSTTVAGDAGGGIVTMNIETNPAGAELPISIIVTDLFLRHTGNSALAVQLSAAASWEEPAGMLTGVLIAGESQSALRLVTPEAPMNYGRVTPGTSGVFNVKFATNTDATSYVLESRGVWSAHDFVLPVGLTP